MQPQRIFRSALAAAILSGLGALIAAGCQAYDFQPVDALAVAQTTLIKKVEARVKPNIMLLVDTSGSMNDPSCSGCTTTRWSELKGAMNGFLSSHGTVARFGLTNYPANNVCAPAGQTQVHFDITSDLRDDDVAGLQARANQINDTLQNVLKPQGGTPTGESVRFVGGLSSLRDPKREDFILLLTDGLPNCNPDNPVNGVDDPAACKCTLASSCTITPAPGGDDFRRLGCLDANVSVQRISELEDQGIRTIVIGFGALLTGGDAESTLNAMADAGGFPRSCSGGGSCTRYYQAGNQAELAAVLQAIAERLDKPCLVPLAPEQQPTDPSLLLVKLTENGETRTAVLGSDYTLTAEGVEFMAGTCTRLQESSADKPITVEVYAVQKL